MVTWKWQSISHPRPHYRSSLPRKREPTNLYRTTQPPRPMDPPPFLIIGAEDDDRRYTRNTPHRIANALRLPRKWAVFPLHLREGDKKSGRGNPCMHSVNSLVTILY